MVAQVMKFKPDLVVTEKGLSDFAAHHFQKAGIAAIRRLRKTDNNRIARACGATIVNRPEDIRESDIGTGAGLFEVVKIADEFWACVVDCDAPQACTVLLRGANKDVLNEVERNLQARPCLPCPVCASRPGHAGVAPAWRFCLVGWVLWSEQALDELLALTCPCLLGACVL